MLLLNAGVQRIWPAAFIEIYGSYVTKLSSGSSSDLDLVVCFGDSNSCAYSNVISGSIEGSSQTSSSPFSQKIKDRDQGVSNLIGVRGVIPLLQTLAEYLPTEMGKIDNQPVLR